MNSKFEALRAKKADGGFTLVELLIVIVVLGILAGITVFGVAQFKSDAETAACAASAKTVTVAAQAYNAQNAKYPASVADLVTGKYLDAAPTPAASASVKGVVYDPTTGTATCKTNP